MTKKSKLKEIYDKIAEGVKIRSKCFWYQYSEKAIILFLWTREEKYNKWNYKNVN